MENITYRPQTITIADKKELYRAYMPYISGGALFFPFNEEVTAEKIYPGQKMLIIFSIFENKQKFPIQGKVIWISKHGLNKGFGISFGENPQMKNLKETIESAISELMIKKEATSTI